MNSKSILVTFPSDMICDKTLEALKYDLNVIPMLDGITTF